MPGKKTVDKMCACRILLIERARFRLLCSRLLRSSSSVAIRSLAQLTRGINEKRL